MPRAVLNALLFLTAIFFPWWVTFLVATFGAWKFSRYGEIVALGVFLDVLRGTPAGFFFGFFYTILALVILVVMSIIKERVR